MEKKTEWLEKMTRYSYMKDEEIAHSLADKLLCEILREYGYTEIADRYENMRKWYA